MVHGINWDKPSMVIQLMTRVDTPCQSTPKEI
jgi:hypothetical protein